VLNEDRADMQLG
jgi:hypothetical protein